MSELGTGWEFDEPPFKANGKMIQVFSRTYPLHRIEKIGLRRDPLYFGLGIILPLLGFAITFDRYLYAGEKLMIYGGSLLAVAILSQVGVLYIQAGASYAPAAVWRMRNLRRFHSAIVQLMA